MRELLSAHGLVLQAIGRDPQATVSQLAEAAGITERYTNVVLADLTRWGVIRSQRQGRRATRTASISISLARVD